MPKKGAHWQAGKQVGVRTGEDRRRRVGGRRTHLMLAVVISSLTTHSFRDGTPFLLLSNNRHLNIWALSRFLPHTWYYITSYSLPLWLPVVTICLLGWRLFPRYYSMYRTSPCHTHLLSSSPLTSSVPQSTVHYQVCRLYSRLRRHTGSSVHLLLPPPDCWCNSVAF